MRTFKLRSPRPDLEDDVIRLWLAPGLTRIGLVFGYVKGIRGNNVGICWDTAAERTLWQAELSNRMETLPDPDFDRDLTHVAYHVSGELTYDEWDSYLALRQIDKGTNSRLEGLYPAFPAMTSDGGFVFATASNQTNNQRELRRWSLSSSFGGRAKKRKDTVEITPDLDWAIRLPFPRRGLVAQMGCNPTVLTMAPDGRFIACGRYDGSASVWSLANRREVVAIPALKMSSSVPMSVYQLAFSADGTKLAALRGKWFANGKYHGFVVSVWAVPGGKQEKGPKEKVSVNGVAFSPDGQTLLTAREDGTVGVWDVATWKLRREYAWKIGKLFSVAFAPDGLTCAAGGENGQVVVWDVDV